MGIFKRIKDFLSRIGIISTYVQKESFIPSEPTVKEEDHRDVIERIRLVFEQQSQQLRIRSLKMHDISCADNWTCTKNPCYFPEPDQIVKHRKNCVHFNGIIITKPFCKCASKKHRIKDKDMKKDNYDEAMERLMRP